LRSERRLVADPKVMRDLMEDHAPPVRAKERFIVSVVKSGSIGAPASPAAVGDVAELARIEQRATAPHHDHLLIC
jgi:hypothetical protein